MHMEIWCIILNSLFENSQKKGKDKLYPYLFFLKIYSRNTFGNVVNVD